MSRDDRDAKAPPSSDAERGETSPESWRKADAFVQHCYNLRIDKGGAAEDSYIRDQHRKLFRGPPKQDTPPSVVQARVYYELARRGLAADEWEQTSRAFRRRAKAAQGDDYSGWTPNERFILLLCDGVDEAALDRYASGRKRRAGARRAGGGSRRGGQKMARYELFGTSAASALRALGAAGMTTKAAKAFVEKKGVGCSPTTVQCQVGDGASGAGKRGKPAELSKDQIKEALDFQKKFQAAKDKPKKGKPKKSKAKPKKAKKAKTKKGKKGKKSKKS